MATFTTADKIARHLKLAGGPDVLAQECAEAVNALLVDRRELLKRTPAGALEVDADGENVPTASAALGALMLGARLHRRRSSTGGTESVDATVANYGAKSDPDIARLLRMDQYGQPGVA